MTTSPTIIDEVEGLYKVIALAPFRKTEGVSFDILDTTGLPPIAGIDRVLHDTGALSPGPVAGVERPWYCHPYQEDYLMVLHGLRHTEIYTKRHKRVEHFEVGPHYIKKNDSILYEGPAMLVWPCMVFHRIRSADSGSASINLAVRFDGFDIDTNFNIYSLDPATGESNMIRAGHLDQMIQP